MQCFFVWAICVTAIKMPCSIRICDQLFLTKNDSKLALGVYLVNAISSLLHDPGFRHERPVAFTRPDTAMQDCCFPVTEMYPL